MNGKARSLTNALLSGAAGFASFVFSLAAFLYVKGLDGQVVVSLVAGIFCIFVIYIASERANSESSRALTALADRILAVENGDLLSPAPEALRKSLPDLANAVDRLFSEVRSSIENAHALGMYDPVTSLPNRLYFRAGADKLLGAEDSARKGALLFVDLDRFKAVNDSFGHAFGDRLLVMVANRLRVVATAQIGEQINRRPLLARLAGDEFTLFFAEYDSPEEMVLAARRIVLSLSEPFEIDGHFVDVGASVGIALSPAHGSTVEELLRAADIAMYRAKAAGGGRHRLFDDGLAEEHRERVEVESALSAAVQSGQFLLAMQPQLSLLTGDLVGTEALLRWNHPNRGLLSPGSFLAVAERTGQILEIGDWVMEEVAVTLAAWSQQGIARRMAFNISARQLERPEFFARLRNIFADQGVALADIELEISETAAMEASAAVIAEFAALRSLGARITLDDFGTGYSNIARLRSLPLDRVKLDPSLIDEIESSEQARNIVQAVIRLIDGVGCEIIAEAVETAAQADILRTMGCHTVQGHVFAKAMFEQDYLDWTRNAGRPSAIVA